MKDIDPLFRGTVYFNLLINRYFSRQIVSGVKRIQRYAREARIIYAGYKIAEFTINANVRRKIDRKCPA